MATTKQQVFGNVFVTAASGYIGQGIARAFRREGYTVYGSTRDSKKAAALQANEIIPVIGSKAEDFKEYIEKAHIIIDCSSTLLEKDPTEFPLSLLKAAEDSRKDPLVPPQVFIYTSGIMVYGHDERIRDENWPIDNTKYYSKWRRVVEERVVGATKVRGIVIRPGWVFGGNGGPFASTIFPQPEAELEVYGEKKDKRYSWVHIDDLAAAYVSAAIQSAVAKGIVFNIVNGYDNPVFAELLIAGARLSGNKKEMQYKKNREGPEFVMDKGLDDSVVLHSALATRVLGWTPKIFGFVDNLPFYYQTTLANREK